MTKTDIEIMVRKLYKMSKGNNTGFQQLLVLEQEKIKTHTITCEVRKKEVFVLVRDKTSDRLMWDRYLIKI